MGTISAYLAKEILKMYDLSVCLAAIRRENWNRLYQSIETSIGQYTFEIIFCGPHEELPEELQGLKNVKCIQDYGCPTRAQQISIEPATGRYLTWAADDGWFLPNRLAQCIQQLDSSKEKKKAIIARYIEGGRDGLGNYCMNYHEPVRSPYYSDSFLIFNCVVMPTKYFKSLGGFDCRFEACPMAYIDLGARAQKDGCHVETTDIIFECTHFPGDSGDHAPIHYAQLDHDQPLYALIWRDPTCMTRSKIDFDNWKEQPDVWERRFGTLSEDWETPLGKAQDIPSVPAPGPSGPERPWDIKR